MKQKTILIVLGVVVLVLAAFFLGQRMPAVYKKKAPPIKKTAQQLSLIHI